MKLFELCLKTGDLAAARHFYHDVLNLPILEQTAQVLALQAGVTRLVFEYVPDWQGKYHFAFNIPENQITEAVAWISAKAPLATLNDKIIFNSSVRWNAHMVYFYDPAGNILEFIARHDLRNAASEPFSQWSILSISEIGLATGNVQQTVQWLCDTLGLTVYDGAGSDTFSAVGDEHGLLIVAREGRIWYPETGISAGLHPVDVTIAGRTAGSHTVSALPYRIHQVDTL